MKGYFCDNEVYAAADINSMLAELFGAGVIAYPDTAENILRGLNDVTNAVLTGGVTTANALKVVATADGYSVSGGSCVLPSGALLRVNPGGEVIDVLDGECFVFANHDIALNTVGIEVSSSEPTSENALVLARIDADGNIEDRRQIAKTKVNTFGKNAKCEFEKSLYFKCKEYMAYNIDVPGVYNLIMINDGKDDKYVDISDGKEKEIYTNTFGHHIYAQMMANGLEIKTYNHHIDKNQGYENFKIILY